MLPLLFCAKIEGFQPKVEGIRYLFNIRFYIMDMVVRHRLEPKVSRLRSFKEEVANTFATPSNSHPMHFSLPFPL